MKRDFIFVIALIFFQGYASLPDLRQPAVSSAQALAVPSITSTPDYTATPESVTFTPTPTFVITPTLPPVEDMPTPTAEPLPGVKRVLIVSFDGMRADAPEAADMKHLLNLMDSGAYTLSARTIAYPTTLPGHTSMLSGLCMEKHGIRWDSSNFYNGYAKGTNIFMLAHDAGMKTIMIVGKEKLRMITRPETTDVFEVYSNEARIAQAAIKYMPDDFSLMFLHFPSPDFRGHKFGWMSKTQFGALREGDDALGEILAALDQYHMLSSTLVIVTADHGGHDKTHDGTLVEDYYIPWVMVGPGVVPQHLTGTIRIMDTAPTVAYALGLPLQPEWDGLPVYQAFGVPAQDVHYNSSGCE